MSVYDMDNDILCQYTVHICLYFEQICQNTAYLYINNTYKIQTCRFTDGWAEFNDSVFNHLRHLFRANLLYCFLESYVAATWDHAITYKTGVAQLIYEQTGLFTTKVQGYTLRAAKVANPGKTFTHLFLMKSF